jgi:hypothetical protein
MWHRHIDGRWSQVISMLQWCQTVACLALQHQNWVADAKEPSSLEDSTGKSKQLKMVALNRMQRRLWQHPIMALQCQGAHCKTSCNT